MKRKIIERENGLRQITLYYEDNTVGEIYTVDQSGKKQGEAISYNTADGNSKAKTIKGYQRTFRYVC